MEVGDLVRIYDLGKVYNTYAEMAAIMRLLHWKSGTLADKFTDNVFTIVNIQKDMVCGIDNGFNSFIIGINGLKLVHTVKDSLSRREKSEKYWQEREKRENDLKE